MPINLPHDGASDKFISDDEILELLNHVRNNPTTRFQHADNLEPTTTTRLPRCSNSKFQQYMRGAGSMHTQGPQSRAVAQAAGGGRLENLCNRGRTEQTEQTFPRGSDDTELRLLC